MRTLKDLKLLPVWVNSGHLISTALLIMRGHRLRALGVIDEGRLVGILSAENLVGHAESAPVSEAMVRPSLVLDLSEPIRRVAEHFIQTDADFAPVVDGEHFVGIVTSTMLLRELGRSWDPLTNLSWSDSLREWGVEHLKAGQEITILFLDLDDFGSYNKTYGHIVGDRVLRRTADMLRESIDEDRDVLVRYGGDEFAIGTIRERPEAEKLADELHEKMGGLFLDAAHQPVSFSLGICGGKRTKERENVHFMATLDSLINMASRESQKQKKEKNPTAPVAPTKAVAQIAGPTPAAHEGPKEAAVPTPGRPTIVMVSADESSMTGTTSVWLNLDGNVASGVHLREGKPLIESVATATADALRKAFPGFDVVIDNIYLTEKAGGIRVAGVSGRVRGEGGEAAISATRNLGADLYTDIAEATIEAFLSRPELQPMSREESSEDDDFEAGQSS